MSLNFSNPSTNEGRGGLVTFVKVEEEEEEEEEEDEEVDEGV